jgi:6-phosphofructokinase
VGRADRRSRCPKTIDNDIPFLDQSFGFQTAFSRASKSIHAVTVEAKSTAHGVGLVKLMGRTAGSSPAMQRWPPDAHLVIPEVAFHLDGEGGVLSYVQRRVRERGYAVVVVAEGLGRSCSMASRPRRLGKCQSARHRAVAPATVGRTRCAVSRRSEVDPHGDPWLSVLEATGQLHEWPAVR